MNNTKTGEFHTIVENHATGAAGKEFTFTWYVENFSSCWHKRGERLDSPTFFADTMQGTAWNLGLYPRGEDGLHICCYLKREADGNEPHKRVALNYELSLLAPDGSPMKSVRFFFGCFRGGTGYGAPKFARRDEVLEKRRSEFLPLDILTVQCRMWTGDGIVSDSGHSFARTRIGVEKVSFVETVGGLGKLRPGQGKTVHIESSSTVRSLVSMTISVTDGLCGKISISPAESKQSKYFTCKLLVSNGTGNRIQTRKGDAWFNQNLRRPPGLTFYFQASALTERKGVRLTHDVLRLQCECVLTMGVEFSKIEQTVCRMNPMPSQLAPNSSQAGSACRSSGVFLDGPGVLDDLRTLYNEQILSDVKLKTLTQTFPAHKAMLSARSPVFKAMLSTDMKENTNNTIEVDDLEDDMVRRLLLFLYTDFLENLQWQLVCKLYYAADKYQVQRLKTLCSSFLVENLSATTACELLILADIHQDVGLKASVEDFILGRDDEIFGSSEWRDFTKSHPRLAMDTMLLKYRKNR